MKNYFSYSEKSIIKNFYGEELMMKSFHDWESINRLGLGVLNILEYSLWSPRQSSDSSELFHSMIQHLVVNELKSCAYQFSMKYTCNNNINKI